MISNMKKIVKTIFLSLSLIFTFDFSLANDHLEKIRIGTLQYGSVNWELDLIKNLNLDKQNELNVEIVQLASKNAAAVALQGNAVDLIVTDWFWVSRQRSNGRMFSFVPHSMAAGGLIVNNNSSIENLSDLKGKKIGIAGGQIDKSWLIFRAYYKEKYGEDLKVVSKQIFGAPPLLNKKIEQQDFDAILTYWPYQARLLAKDFKKVINISEIIENLKISSNVPVIGWVFRDDWSDKNVDLLKRFLKTSDEAKKVMLESDEVWNSIKPSMKVKDEKTFILLRDIYREGIPQNFTLEGIKSAKILFNKLANIGGPELVGKQKELFQGTFWVK